MDIPYVGGIAGIVSNSEIRNCTVTGVIDVIGGQYVGGAVGMLFAGVYDSVTFIDVTPQNTPAAQQLTITVTNPYSDAYVGGLVGYQESGNIEDCTAQCDVSVSGGTAVYAGGVVGYAKDTFINNKTKLSTIEIGGDTAETTNLAYVGGAAGALHKATEGLEVTDTTVKAVHSGKIQAGGIVGSSLSAISGCDAIGISIEIDVPEAITDAKLTTAKNVAYAGGIVGIGTELNDCTVIFVNRTQTHEPYVLSVKRMADLYVGGAAGQASDVLNLAVTGKISVEKVTAKLYAGGIAGQSAGEVGGTFNADAETVESMLEIGSLSTVAQYVGGIAGEAVTVKNSEVKSRISILANDSGKAGDFYVGGIAGDADAVEDSAYNGAIAVNGNKAIYVGGIAGNALTVKNSDAQSFTIDVTAAKKADAYVAGIAGQATQEISGCNAVINGITVSCLMDGTAYVGGIAGQVKGAAKALTAVRFNTVSGTAFTTGIKALSDYNDTASSNVCGAILNVGGVVGNAAYADISDCSSIINVTASSFGKTAIGQAFVGGIAGQTDAATLIAKAFATGFTLNGTAYKTAYVGGAVGLNKGTITNAYSYGVTIVCNLSSTGLIGNVGGFVGSNDGTVSSAYAANYVNGTVGQPGTMSIGGFAGNNTKLIQGCFSTGYRLFRMKKADVEGTNSGVMYMGGFIGKNEDVKNCAISNCYSDSRAYASAFVGGFAGMQGASATMTSCIAKGLVNGGSSDAGSNVNGFTGTGATGYTGCVNYCYENLTENVLGGTKQVNTVGGTATTNGIRNFAKLDLLNASMFINVLQYNPEVWHIENGSEPYLTMDEEIWVMDEEVGCYVFVAAEEE